ncbi:hypothetical protein [Luteimonas sp. SDU101]|uniref:hypothetical protein n=1 Tax=Luteimonas sp. SDU101 TaxID=3422593 RepID=UPI003EBF0BA2
MRAIHALAQCEGMDVEGMTVEVVCQISLHGQSAELRLPYSDTKYACHAVASSAISRLAVELAHAAALSEDVERTASLERAKALLDSGAWERPETEEKKVYGVRG